MEIWIKDIELIKQSPNPLETAFSIIFKCIAKEQWIDDTLIRKILNSEEFTSSNRYQNQYKAACVMYSSFFLLKQEIHKGFEQHLLALIFASLFHNFKHKGKTNKYSFENEKFAIEQMYDFADKNDFIKLWGKHSWMNLKSMPTWVNLTDAIEEIILVSDFSDVKNITSNYLKYPDTPWRADLPLQINKLKQIFLEALLLPNVMEPFLLQENKNMLEENGSKFPPELLKRQVRHFLQNFATDLFVSRASAKLHIPELIHNNSSKI